MHLLYLDDSGSVGNADDKHVFLAGLSVFERQTHWLSQSLDQVAAKYWPDSPQTLEFRGSDMFSGRKHWRGHEKDVRERAFIDALRTIADMKPPVKLFAAAVHRGAISPDDPMEYAFEQLTNRFDRMLGRLHKAGDTHRGLIVLDKSSYETSLQSLALTFKTSGHRWGQVRNMAETPLFVDSRATRLIQAADLIAYAIRRYYNRGEAKYFDIIKHRFDAEGGVIHGLTHWTPAGERCNCYACGSGLSARKRTIETPGK